MKDETYWRSRYYSVRVEPISRVAEMLEGVTPYERKQERAL